MLALRSDDSEAPADLVVSGGRYVSSGYDLQTAAWLTVYCNAPAKPGDYVPEGASRDGWWAQAYLDPGEIWGSRWWLLAFHNATPEILVFAEEILREAFQRWIDRGWASKVEVGPAEYRKTSAGDTALACATTITAPGGGTETFEAWAEVA